jgi:hypothetical protein
MTEAPGDAADPQRDLLEEMHYALGLAQERERSAKEEMDRLPRLFVTQYFSLEERVRSAEREAERAEVSAAGLEERVNKSLQGIGLQLRFPEIIMNRSQLCLIRRVFELRCGGLVVGWVS